MTNNTDTQSTIPAILTIRKGDKYVTSETYADEATALVNRDALAILMPSFTFGLILDCTDPETVADEGVSFELHSENGKIKHGVPTLSMAHKLARKYATPDNEVHIVQVIVTEEVKLPGGLFETIYSTPEAAMAASEA